MTETDQILQQSSIEANAETKNESSAEPEVDTVKAKKLSQLAAARESAKIKKRKREEELDSMSERLDTLTSLLLTKDKKHQGVEDPEEEEEEEPKIKKPKRVTKEADTPVQGTQEDSWTTSLIRTGSLISLAGLSYYFQNLYGKSTTAPQVLQKKKTTKPNIRQPVQFNNSSSTAVGKSGFTF
jgi:hypothetical protein